MIFFQCKSDVNYSFDYFQQAAANIKSEGSTGTGTGSNQSDGSPSAGRHSPVSPPACGAGIDINPDLQVVHLLNG